ncbi:hypothetical protein SDC9_203130 [bioreactor metagenome]|uniref:Uncharacterized protein n=1 Tax=bioreactor metagenome TaxID=1076179 RepID=A0A645IVK6_9ZZZZ
MDDQTHVGLVHAHAEGVGGGNDAQAAGEKGFLHRAFFRRQHASVKMAAGEPGLFQE